MYVKLLFITFQDKEKVKPPNNVNCKWIYVKNIEAVKRRYLEAKAIARTLTNTKKKKQNNKKEMKRKERSNAYVRW